MSDYQSEEEYQSDEYQNEDYQSEEEYREIGGGGYEEEEEYREGQEYEQEYEQEYQQEYEQEYQPGERDFDDEDLEGEREFGEESGEEYEGGEEYEEGGEEEYGKGIEMNAFGDKGRVFLVSDRERMLQNIENATDNKKHKSPIQRFQETVYLILESSKLKNKYDIYDKLLSFSFKIRDISIINPVCYVLGYLCIVRNEISKEKLNELIRLSDERRNEFIDKLKKLIKSSTDDKAKLKKILNEYVNDIDYKIIENLSEVVKTTKNKEPTVKQDLKKLIEEYSTILESLNNEFGSNIKQHDILRYCKFWINLINQKN